MVIINKGKLLKTTGWITVGVGLYLVSLGTFLDDDDPDRSFPRPPDDDIIDAEWYEVD